MALEATVLRLLLAHGWTMATAESCTAGGLSARITRVPGASAAFLGGVVAYAPVVKEEVLGVSRDSMERYGVVSTAVTEEMAIGVKKLFHADVVCSVSGYFGPTGGTERSPIGTVCATFSLPAVIVSETFFFTGSRKAICASTVQALLSKLVILLHEDLPWRGPHCELRVSS